MPEENVGNTDKIIRYILAVILFGVALYLGFNSQVTSAIIVGVIGLIPLITAYLNFCPLYRIFGISSCKTSSKTA